MKYFRNMSWLFGEKIFRMVISLLISVWMARYLGADQFGLFSYVQSFIALFAGIATLGLDSIIVKELVKNETHRDELLGTAFWLKILGAIIVLVVTAIAIMFTSDNMYTILLIFIIASSVVFQSFNVIDLYYQSQLMSKYVALANAGTLFLSSLIKIILILSKAPLIYFVIMVLFDSIIFAIGLIYFYLKQKLTLRHWSFNKNLAIKLLKTSWPLVLASLALGIQAYIDQIMIMQMLGSTDVGYYSVAIKLIAIFSIIPAIIQNTFDPAIIQAKKVSQELYITRLTYYYKLAVILFLITAIPILFFSKPIIILTFGSEYENAASLFALMAIRLLFTNMGMAKSSFILAEGLFRYSLVTMSIGAITNISINYILIPIYGSKGAIIATIISFSLTVFILDLFYHKTRSNSVLMLKSTLQFYKFNLKDLK